MHTIIAKNSAKLPDIKIEKLVYLPEKIISENRNFNDMHEGVDSSFSLTQSYMYEKN